MEIIICENYEEMSKKAAEIFIGKVKENPKCVLGMATGSTPIGLYKNLIADHKDNHTSYHDVTTFNLDEYVGLPKSHEQSYYSFMHDNLFNHIDIQEKNVHIPVGESDDLAGECAKYEEAMSHYTVDIQLLGVGRNGHIGFNEPGTPFTQTTHIVDLDSKTITDNARFFEGDMSKVPTRAITMGIATIMRAKKIVLLASGKNKEDAIYELVKGEKSENCPITALKDHKDVVVIIDKDAASRI